MPKTSFMTNIHDGSTDNVRKLNDYLYKVCKAEQESLKRNQQFLSDIEKVSSKAEALKEKTEKLKEIRNDYKSYVSRLYPAWQKSEENLNRKSRDTEEERSSYPEFLQKKILDWKHDASLNLPSAYHGTTYSPRSETKDSISLLEEQLVENQLQLAELHKAMQKQTELENLLCQKDQQIKELKRKMKLQHSGQYLGDLENYVPSYRSESRNTLSKPLYTSSPEKQVLPVLDDFMKSSFTSQNDSFSTSQGPNSIKILPQLLAVTPTGQLLLLPMTNSLDSTISHEQFSSTINENGENVRGNMMENASFHKPNKASPIPNRGIPNSPVSEHFSDDKSIQFVEATSKNLPYLETLPKELTGNDDEVKLDHTNKNNLGENFVSKKIDHVAQVHSSSPEDIFGRLSQKDNSKSGSKYDLQVMSPLDVKSSTDATSPDGAVVNLPEKFSEPINLDRVQSVESTYNDKNLNTDSTVNQNSPKRHGENQVDEHSIDYHNGKKVENSPLKMTRETHQPSEGASRLEEPPRNDASKSGSVIVSPVPPSLDDKTPTNYTPSVDPVVLMENLAKPSSGNLESVNTPLSNTNDRNSKNISGGFGNEVMSGLQDPPERSEEEDSKDHKRITDFNFVKDKDVEESIFSDFSEQYSDFELPSVANDNSNTPADTKQPDRSSDRLENEKTQMGDFDDMSHVLPRVEENDYDDTILFHLLETVMERVNDQSSDEMLVLNLDRNLDLINTILGVADVSGDLTKFNASEICMAFTYQLEQTMLEKPVPFITGELDETNDFEGHLRDCISSDYLDIWDALFAFISSIMDAFEFNPSQVAAVYAFALTPSDRQMCDQLRVSLTNILSANLPDNSLKEDPVGDVTGRKASSVSITETFEFAGHTTSHDVIKDDVISSSIHDDDEAFKPIENRLTEEILNSLDKRQTSIVPKKSEDDTSSTMSFDSDGLPVPKSKKVTAPLSEDKDPESNTDIESSDQHALSRSSSAYMKMREESLMSPVHEDSDEFEDELGKSLRVKNIKKEKPASTFLCSSEDILHLQDEPQNGSKGAIVSPVHSSVDVKSTLNVKSPTSSTEVVLKKPGFWDHSDSESEFDVNSKGKHDPNDKNDDDDFDFDFYD